MWKGCDCLRAIKQPWGDVEVTGVRLVAPKGHDARTARDEKPQTITLGVLDHITATSVVRFL